MQTLYEVHSYNRGNWQIDSIYDDRDLAVYEARVLERNGRCTAVRVIKESYDPERNYATAAIVYKAGQGSLGRDHGVIGRPPRSAGGPSHRPSAPRADGPVALGPVRGRPVDEEPAHWYMMLALKGGVLIFFGLALLIALKKLSELI